MKGSIKLMLIVVFGLLIFFGARLLLTQEASKIETSELLKASDTTTQETYVSQVIISAPWAEKNLVYGGKKSPPAEFGYTVDDERFIGPSCFAIAPNGDIYIADQFNHRIQKFNSAGAFISTIPMPRIIRNICIDRESNIYLVGGGNVSEGGILKYDQEGNLLKTYPLSYAANFIYCDKLGRIFVACPGMGPYQAGSSQEIFSFDQQRESELGGFLGTNSVALNQNAYFQSIPMSKAPHCNLFRYYLIGFEGDTIHVYESGRGIEGNFFGCDEDLNIYVGSYSGMRKYNLNGNLIASWKFGCEEPYLEVYDFGGSRGRTLDEKGNLYLLCYSESKEHGIKVIKWYKQ